MNWRRLAESHGERPAAAETTITIISKHPQGLLWVLCIDMADDHDIRSNATNSWGWKCQNKPADPASSLRCEKPV